MAASYYFTWPDGVFSYECRGCGACCKGHGIGLDGAAGEVERLAELHPPVIAFLRRRGGATTAFNPRDRCWFLADDGLCRVEVDHGRAAKPASCRLFPFNRVFRLGSWTIVDYNSVICPMRAGGERATTHAEIRAEIEGISDAAVVGTALPPDSADAFVAREVPLAQTFFEAARTGDLERATAGIDRGAVEDAFAALGTTWRAPEGDTLAAALWLTPSMRFNELYGPRQYVPRAALVDVLPRMCLAWLGFAALGAELARRPLGMQELTTIWSEQAPLMYAAARWRDAPALAPGPLEMPDDASVRALGRAFVDNRGARRPLGALFAPILAARAAHERPLAVKLSETVLRAGFTAPSGRRR